MLCALKKKALILIDTDPKIVEDIEGAISGCHQQYLTSTDLDQLFSVNSLLDP